MLCWTVDTVQLQKTFSVQNYANQFMVSNKKLSKICHLSKEFIDDASHLEHVFPVVQERGYLNIPLLPLECLGASHRNQQFQLVNHLATLDHLGGSLYVRREAEQHRTVLAYLANESLERLDTETNHVKHCL